MVNHDLYTNKCLECEVIFLDNENLKWYIHSHTERTAIHVKHVNKVFNRPGVAGAVYFLDKNNRCIQFCIFLNTETIILYLFKR